MGNNNTGLGVDLFFDDEPATKETKVEKTTPPKAAESKQDDLMVKSRKTYHLYKKTIRLIKRIRLEADLQDERLTASEIIDQAVTMFAEAKGVTLE